MSRRESGWGELLGACAILLVGVVVFAFPPPPHWRDHYGHVRSVPREQVPYWRQDREFTWDEINEGMYPGRSEYKR